MVQYLIRFLREINVVMISNFSMKPTMAIAKMEHWKVIETKTKVLTKKKPRFLSDGLGQLTDGILAGDDYRSSENVQGIGSMGYDWIGWKRRSSLELIFHFPTIENLTSIRIHTSNLFTRDIYLFHSIFIANCHNDLQTTFLLIPEDSKNIQARFINISLAFGHGMLSNCLKLTLTFNNRSKWILISEVLFQSQPIIPHLSTLPTTMYTHNPPTIIGRHQFFRIMMIVFGFFFRR